jgi:uncharacterized protein (TIGR03437 family)
MKSFYVRRMLSMTMAAAALGCLASSENLVAAGPSTAPSVTYTASGTFGSVKSGADLFQLQGEPFSISVVASEADVAKTHGAQWAGYNALKMTGTVNSGLLPTPVAISNTSTSIELAVGNPSYDVFELYSPVKVIGITLTITATIDLPKTALTIDHILPFASVALPTTATMSYSDGTNTSVLYLKGTLVGTVPGAAAVKTDVVLHGEGARSITARGDGTKSVRSIGAGPVETGASADVVALEFYAAGVRDGSEIEVRIGGQSVPVLYAGAAEHFAGLDQISVQLPRSLAGVGEADVVLTVDGQTAEPVRIQIQ